MKIDHKLDQIINDNLPAIISGEETLESILAKHPGIAPELRPRLEAAVWLRKARFALATRPGYIHDSRKYLETKIESMPPSGFWHKLFWRYTPKRWVFNFLAPVIVTFLLVLVINSAVLTARLAIPGETLYPAKLVIEDVRMAFTFNEVNRADLSIQSSRERALEFVELVMEGDYDRLPAAAGRMEQDIIASLHALDNIDADDPAIERSKITNFNDTLTNEIFILNVLKTTSPSYAQQGIELAIRVAQSGIFALR